MSQAKGVDEGTGAAGHHDIFVVLDPGPVYGLAFDQVDLEDHIHRGLETRPRHLAMALASVPVTEIEVGAVVEDRQIDGGPLPDLGRIHVSTEIARPQPAERLRTARSDREAPEHRPQVDGHLPHAAIWKLGRRRHVVAIQAPEVTALGYRLVEQPHPRVRGQAPEVRIDAGGGQIVIGPHPVHSDDQHVARRRALDVDRPYLAGKGAPLLRVVSAEVRLRDEHRAGFDAKHRFAHRKGRLSDLGREVDRIRRRAGIAGLHDGGHGHRQQRVHRHLPRKTPAGLSKEPCSA